MVSRLKIAQFVITFVILLSLFSCQKETEFDIPFILTGEVTDINSDGATFNARISNLIDSEVLEYGFVWNSETSPTIENSQKYIVGKTPEDGILNTRISTALKENVTYFVRAYLKTKTEVIYGLMVQFTSQGGMAPKINNLSPESGNLNDTLLITGENFSAIKTDNKIYFGELSSKVIKAKQDSLWCIVPTNLKQPVSTVSVSIFEKKATCPSNFKLIPPMIDKDIIIGTFGSQITINGDNFTSNINSLKAYFDESKIEINEVNNQFITVTAPVNIDQRNSIIRIEMNNLSSTTNFILDDLELIDFTPKIAITNDTLILYGKNFHPVTWRNQVSIGGGGAEVISAELNKLEVKLSPNQNYLIYSSRNVNIDVTVIGQTQSYNSTLLINDKWFRVQNMPFEPKYTSSVIANKNIYFINSTNTDGNDPTNLWCFNSETLEWEKLPNFPGLTRVSAIAFNINNKIYYGTGYNVESYVKKQQNDFWEYDIVSGVWNQLNNFSGGKRSYATSFAINSKGYIVGGINYERSYVVLDDCWEYTPETDNWTEKQNIFYPDTKIEDGLYSASAIVNDNSTVLGLGYNLSDYSSGDRQRMFVFNPSNTNHWSQIESFPEFIRDSQLSFIWEGKPVFYAGETFFSYNILSNNWTSLWANIDAFTKNRYDYKWVIVNKDKIYFGLYNQVWEYDPNR